MEWLLLFGGIIGVVIAGLYVVKKRREREMKGWRSAMTSICFLTTALMMSIASFFDLLGILTWGLTMMLILIGAYFTKFVPTIK